MTEKPNNFVMMRWLQWKRTFRFFYFSGKTSFRYTHYFHDRDMYVSLHAEIKFGQVGFVIVGVRTAQASSARRFWY
ncbi:hypothetical protein KCU69_g50, partial [Aureobasidium melanogenum]